MIFPKAMKYDDVQERELNIQLLQVIITRVHFPPFCWSSRASCATCVTRATAPSFKTFILKTTTNILYLPYI